MNDIEHYNPLFTYRPGRLQVVSDALSRMPGVREEGLPADTPRFLAMEDTPKTPRRRAKYFRNMKRYLKGKSIEEDILDDIKETALDYTIRDGRLWQGELPVIYNQEEANEIIELVHKDLGHYGKETTKDVVKKRYLIASDLWRKGTETLDSCVPCQLYKPPRDMASTATIHIYGIKAPFALWEIDFFGRLVKSYRGYEYVITAIDYATSDGHREAPQDEDQQKQPYNCWKRLYGRMESLLEIITDNGAEFRSDEFYAVRKRYGIRHNKTSPGHPQTNGKVERLNYELYTTTAMNLSRGRKTS